MKRFLILLLVILLVCCFISTQAEYTVNGRKLTDMSVEELYDLEDSIVSALTDVFTKNATKTPDGDVIGVYVVNPRTKKFHYPFCYSAIQIGTDRRFEMCTASELVEKGYKACGQCKPYAKE